jgi:hypothetical protein
VRRCADLHTPCSRITSPSPGGLRRNPTCTAINTGGLALVVALGATGWQALRAARTNPVQALRDE